MAKDITSPATAQQVASIHNPEEKNASQPFFSDAARQLLQAAMIALIKSRPGKWTFRDLLLAMNSKERLAALLELHPETRDVGHRYLGSEDRTVASVMATVGTKLGPFEVVAATWSKAKKQISLTSWISSESVLVLANDESFRSVLDPINRVIFKRAVELTLAQKGTSTGRTWFFLDEVREAGNLDGLGRLMTKGRSTGAAVVLGFQDIQGMREAFGKESADEIVGLCANKAILRIESPETAEWASKLLGQYEVLEEKISTTTGESTSESKTNTRGKNSGWSHSFGMNSSSNSTQGGTNSSVATGLTSTLSTSSTNSYERKERSAALASEFMTLPPTQAQTGLTGFFLTQSVAAKMTIRDFPKLLTPEAPEVLRVDHRSTDHQYLKPWTDEELSTLRLKLPPDKSSKTSSSTGASAQVTPAQQPIPPKAPSKLPAQRKHWLPDGSAKSGIRALPDREVR